MSDERGPAAVLEERPELEPALESVLAVDDTHDGWTFDDIDIDSGSFGELVSRGVVEKDSGEYSVADPAAVRAALDGEAVEQDTGDGDVDLIDFSLPAIDTRAAGLLAAALCTVVLMRAYVVGSIYRNGDIVFSGNDPYYYRYWLERIAAEAGGNADFSALAVLPGEVTKGEPLMVATLWWVAELFGGTAESIGHVLAWYPVVSAVASGLLLYLLAVRVTNDRRVGLASVLFLAIIPAHAFRTSLGYGDHHAFDYPWLGLTALALVVLVTECQDRESLQAITPWAGAALLGVGIAGQILSWEAGPLLVVPVGIAIAGKTLIDVDAGRSPLVANAPILVGTGFGSLVVWIAHTSWSWHTTLVASTALLLFAGIAGVTVVAEITARFGGTGKQLAAVEAIGLIVAVLVGRSLFSDRWNEALGRTDLLFRSDAIAETTGLFNFGSLDFLLLLGFALVLALPAMVWGIRRATTDRPDWLVASVYAWYFVALAGIQVRFVGELATFVAFFDGVSFVWLASKIEVARPLEIAQTRGYTDALVPETRTLAVLCTLFLVVGSLGILQVPIKTSQIVTEDGTYQAAAAIERDAAQQNLTYPDNYVLSQWSRNRVYNYFVNGESRSYGYARNEYRQFATAANGTEWYTQRQNRVGYVVTEDFDSGETLLAYLHTNYGSRTDSTPGLGHYQAVYAAEDGSHKAFALVPGAVITGTASPNATVTASSTITLSNGEFEYTRQTQADADGSYRLRVANPGEYTVEAPETTATVAVNESAVRNGTQLSVGQ